MRDWGFAGVDRFIEGEDRDDEPHNTCQECERDIDAQGHAPNCTHHEQYFDNPEHYEIEDDSDAA